MKTAAKIVSIALTIFLSIVVSACLSSLLGCAASASHSATDSPLPPATHTVFVNCAGHTADALFQSPNARYNVLAVITHTDGSEDYQLPAFEPHSSGQTRASVYCFEPDTVAFLDFTPEES